MFSAYFCIDQSFSLEIKKRPQNRVLYASFRYVYVPGILANVNGLFMAAQTSILALDSADLLDRYGSRISV